MLSKRHNKTIHFLHGGSTSVTSRDALYIATIIFCKEEIEILKNHTSTDVKLSRALACAASGSRLLLDFETRIAAARPSSNFRCVA